MIIIDAELCNGCGKCEYICANGAITVHKNTHKAVFNKNRCLGCGACIEECEAGALSMLKKLQRVKAVI